jgi:excisionase family DNA binding protein
MHRKKHDSYSILTQSGLFTSKQIADYIGVCPRTISNMVRQRRIPVIKFGGSVRFDPGKVLTALEKYEIESI